MMTSTRLESRSLRWALRASVLLSAFSWLGCASLPMPDLKMPSFSMPDSMAGLFASAEERPPIELSEPAPFVPRGPGSVFATPDEAAMDALAYSYLMAREVVSSQRRPRGGGISPVEGGFTYAEPSVTSSHLGAKLRYRLRATDVAHYRYYPIQNGTHLDRQNRTLAREVRSFVERRDPVSRPLFYLTPERFMRVYSGTAESGEETLARVERGTRRGATEVELREAIHLASSVATDRPLAHQPMPGAMPAR